MWRDGAKICEHTQPVLIAIKAVLDRLPCIMGHGYRRYGQVAYDKRSMAINYDEVGYRLFQVATFETARCEIDFD